METLLSNPEKLLPYMYEEDGVQKTTFDLTVLETDRFVRDKVIVPLGEMKELEKEPNILIGNRAVNSNQGNDATISRLNVLTKTYDPKGKLDAFVLPTVISREWHMEDEVEMDWFYQDFKFMVRGNKNDVTDTGRVLRHLKAVLDKYQGIEFAGFVTPYLTSLVNRWLVEARGYAETKERMTWVKKFYDLLSRLEVTMATFSPTRRLVRLDLPTFGRPMTATNTEDVS
jgi:hypothetical protein